MSRYLRHVKPPLPGIATGVGPGPKASRFDLDQAAWHARLAAWSGPTATAPADPGRIETLEPERWPTSLDPAGQRAA
jgi:hypothetical protein